MADLANEITKTQATVGAVISKPKMSEKLLSRPPFRFLHDVIMNIDKKTGYIKGLYNDQERDSSTIKDKGAKIAFLDKMLIYLEAAGRPVQCKAQKIVSGLEPEATNVFLQELANVATSDSTDHAKLVRRSLGEEETDQPAPAQAQEQKDEQPPAPVESKNDDTPQPNPDVSRRRDSNASAASTGSAAAFSMDGVDGTWETTIALFEGVTSRPKLSQKLLSKPPFRFIHDIITNTMKNNPGVLEGAFEEHQMDSKQIADKPAKIEFLTRFGERVAADLGTTMPARPAKIVAGLEPERTNKLLQMLAILAKGGGAPAPSSSDQQQEAEQKHETSAPSQPAAVETKSPEADKQDEAKAPSPRQSAPAQSASSNPAASESKDSDGPGDDSGKKTARPTTARRRPPKLKNNVKETESRPGGGGDVDDEATRPVGVMIEGQDDESEDEEDPLDDVLGGNTERNGSIGGGKTAPTGKLAREILDQEREEKAEAEGSVAGNSDEAKQPENMGISMGKVGSALRRGKGGGTSAVDVEAMRKAIQLLCQSTNPLGKCMDYVHEDMETMAKELERWRSEYRTHCDKLEDEQRITQEQLQPQHQKVRDVEDNIKDQQGRIAAIKATIAKNEERTQEQLRWMITG